MCRILASISAEPISLKDYLVDDECSLLRQSTAREDKLQRDGWGVAWYERSWNIEKSPRPVFEEREKIERIAGREYSLFIAHIRKASNPLNLPIEKLRSYENTQPFSYKNWVFAHNGQINHPDMVKESMGEWSSKIRGMNDSEVYFWLLMKYIGERGNVIEAMRSLVEHLHSLWESMPEEDRAKSPYSSLNMVLSDGERLYAYNRYDGRGKDSLCFRDRPYYQMQYLEIPEGIVIASERTSNMGWKAIGDGNILVAERNGDFTVERL